MSQDDDFSISELHRKREKSQAGPTPRPVHDGRETVVDAVPAGPVQRHSTVRRKRSSDEDEEEGNSEWSVDTWRILGAMKRRWIWLTIGAVVMGCAGLSIGYITGTYATSIALIQNGPPGGGSDSYHTETLSAVALTSLIQSPDIIRRVATKANPPITPAELKESVSATLEDKNELLRITLQGRDTGALVNLANLYANETVEFTRELQLAGARRMSEFYREKVTKYDLELKRVNDQMLAFLNSNNIVNPGVESDAYLKQLGDTLNQIETKRIEYEVAALHITDLQNDLVQQNPLADELAAANAKLAALLARYTEQHPAVQDMRAEIALLEQRVGRSGTNDGTTMKFPVNSLASTLQAKIIELKGRRLALNREIQEMERKRTELQRTVTGLSEKSLIYSGIKAELDSLQNTRGLMAGSLREAQLFEENARGYYRVLTPVTIDNVNTRPRLKKAITTGVKGGLAGLLMMAALVFLLEMKDRTMKTVAEVERITGLPVLATLGDLEKMTPQEQDKWAFRAWTVIAGQLSMSANHGMVCGVMSSVHGEGRSTWIRLLGSAASQRGLRVLTVATRASGTEEPSSEAETQANEQSFSEAVDRAMSESKAQVHPNDGETPEKPETTTLSPSVLAFPAEVTERFAAGGLPAAHIPLPGWVWNLERRRQWQMALAHWRAVDNLVLLVELPPASVPESVLLAESLPQIIWLVDSGKPRIGETKEQLEMLHHAKCRIVGAVLNHEPEPIIKL